MPCATPTHPASITSISEGLHPRVIQARLGHRSIVETMDTYGHLFPDQNDETTAALDRLFGDGAPRRDDAV
jgi:integrase